MCGRFNLTATIQEIGGYFDLSHLPRHEVSFNIPPGQKILTIVQLEDNSYKGVYLYWGLIPSWAKNAKTSSHLINARAETLAEKPSFRRAFKKRRCLIPATGFFEWRQTESGKQPFHIYKSDRSLFAFAGLWEHWENNGSTVYSCTIITTSANNFMQAIHKRMPVIIPATAYHTWLNRQVKELELEALLAASDYQNFQATPISNRINNPVHNDMECLHAITPTDFKSPSGKVVTQLIC